MRDIDTGLYASLTFYLFIFLARLVAYFLIGELLDILGPYKLKLI